MGKSNKYGYITPDTPVQSDGANKGTFDLNEINNLKQNNQWTTIGNLNLIETKSVTAGTELLFEDLKTNTYRVHFAFVQGFAPTTSGGSQLQLRFYESGVEQTGTVYNFSEQYTYSPGNGNSASATSSGPSLTSTTDTAGTAKADSMLCFYNLGDSTSNSYFTMHSVGSHPTSTIHIYGGGSLRQTSIVDKIKFFVAADTMDLTVSLYGLGNTL
jgi:hypothetical protein